jgi:methylmalonyl-CoA/ethylmalonyl-CoA epimerase
VSGPVGLDHVAVAVHDLDAAVRRYESLGLRCQHVEDVPSEGVRVAFLPAGEAALELLQPLQPDGPVARFLQARGEGLHHVALRVPDLDAALERARAAGVRVLEPAPRLGSRGRRVAFLHPKDTSGVLVELVEAARR